MGEKEEPMRVRGKKSRAAKKRVAPRDFDTISKDELMRAMPRLSRVFMRYACIGVFLHLLVIAVTIGEVFLVPWWSLYLRAILVPRILLLGWVALCATCCNYVPVALLYRPGTPVKYLRTLRTVPLLALWLMLGYIDVYLLRIPSIILDATAPLWPTSGQTVEASLLRAAIDVAVVLEFYITLNVIYEQGVRRNVLYNLLIKPTQATV